MNTIQSEIKTLQAQTATIRELALRMLEDIRATEQEGA